ncbi:FUSC family protein [Methylobacterium nodulans]|uniref:Fusaric acid resistance protein conserved region n=1 Tax=Methylobacterium nodulans (strain LMG 21967 / CNCM I-2342 / ORS 2060) TaxID=460265 RepID=B8IS36_METNO|nr:FUSC family protein [Methylobacterium nodulans]ACL56848.1 Fusaric acid resistance protein conserved region [Methylobacterium nodulans ORS 2060]
MTLPGWRAWLFAGKTAGAAILALWIALWIDLPRPYWAMATVFITAQALSGATRSKAAYRVGGTLIGVVAAVAMVPNLVNAPELLTLALALWTAGCLYLSLLDRTPRSYLFMLAGYTAALIGFPAVSEPGAIFDTAIARAEEITLGILCAALVSSLVLPQSVAPVVAQRIAAWLAEAGRWTGEVLAGEAEEPAVRARRLRLAADAGEIDVLAAHLAYDTSEQAAAAPWVRLLRGRMLLLLPVLSSLGDRIAALRGLRALTFDLRELLQALDSWAKAGAPVQGVAELTARIEAAERGLAADPGWAALMRASLLDRLRDLVALSRDCRTLEEHIARGGGRLRAPLAYGGEFAACPPRHRDHGMALRSALGVLISAAVCVGLWIATAWPDGATAAMMGLVLCCLFAAQDDPTPSILGFARWSAAAAVAAGLLLFGVLPRVHDFTMLTLAVLPPLMLCGLLMSHPRTAAAGIALGVNGNALLALQDRYNAEFSAFVNSSMALLAGIWIAALVTSLIRSIGAEQGAWRLLRASRRDLARAAARRGRGDRVAFAALMMDRLGLLVPRIAAAPPDSALRRVDTLAELRVGMVLVFLRRARHGLPADQVAALDRVLDDLARHYRRETETADPLMLERIDAALRLIGAHPGPEERRDALLGLAGLRRALFPEAAPYDPARPRADAIREAA